MFQKLVISLVALFMSMSLMAKSYKGQGHWTNDGGMSGFYETYVELDTTGFKSLYVDSYGKKERNFIITGPRSFFEFMLNNEFIGTGFCIPNFCQLMWEEGKDILTEGWTFGNKSILRNGKRTYDGKNVLWQDEVFEN